MNTKNLLAVLQDKQIEGALPENISDMASDSRSVSAGGMFVCIKGFTVDGHDFAEKAAANGASVIIASEPIHVDIEKTAVVYVEDTSRALGLLAARFFNYPSKKMKMIGVTGTNGKTSVSNIIFEILRLSGERSAVSGTIGFNLDGVLYETENTTTDVLTTQTMLNRAVQEDCVSMTMEVSSHGLIEGRLAGTEFDIVVFTNLSHDHLDFHETMEKYGQAKGLLFSQLGQDLQNPKYAVVNADDEWSKEIQKMTPHAVLTFGIHNEAAFKATQIQLTADKTLFQMHTPEGEFSVEMNLIGEFSIYNALAAAASLYAKGMKMEEFVCYLQQITSVKGRMEKVETDLPIMMYVDYAHSPDAIEKAIQAVLPYKKNKVIFLVGTGGNRDRKKRPVMAEKASVADYVILTTDDPRFEPDESILSELEAGMQHDRYACIGDRAEAVRHAISVAEQGDIIIFAGKGHEDFQIIENTKYPHSDADIALEAAAHKFGTGSLKK